MKSRRKTVLKVLAAAAGVLLLAAACSNIFGDGDNGVLSLSITDAPIDADNVDGVFITFEEIQYHRNGQWETFDEFEGPRTIDVLALSGGESELLGEFSLPAGNYTQVRFMLGIGELGAGNEGSYISFNDGTEDKPLFVPSGEQSGYKAQGVFSVPSNGSVSVTADFDLRRAVVETGDGDYILRPVIRLVVDGQAGSIRGTVDGTAEGSSYVVFAYESGEYDDSETAEPDGGDSRFPNSVTSSPVEDGEYTLAFLAEGTYDLVLAEYDNEGDIRENAVVVAATDVEVESGEVTTENLDVSD